MPDIGHRFRFAGARASIRLGYLRAATLGPWTLEGGVFSAAVVDVDGFRITQTPLVLEIPNADGIPTRRVLADVTVAHGRLSASVLKGVV